MSSSTTHRLIFCNCPTQAIASNIANQLVSDGIAACVNVLPGCRSVYKWEGKLCNEEEYLLLIKTTLANYDAVQAVILALHPYELPEIIAVPINAGLPAYLDWMTNSVKDPA